MRSYVLQTSDEKELPQIMRIVGVVPRRQMDTSSPLVHIAGKINESMCYVSPRGTG